MSYIKALGVAIIAVLVVALGMSFIARTADASSCACSGVSEALTSYRHEADIRCRTAGQDVSEYHLRIIDRVHHARDVKFYTTSPYEMESVFHGRGKGRHICAATNSLRMERNDDGSYPLPIYHPQWGYDMFECRVASQVSFDWCISNAGPLSIVLDYIHLEYVMEASRPANSHRIIRVFPPYQHRINWVNSHGQQW